MSVIQMKSLSSDITMAFVVGPGNSRESMMVVQSPASYMLPSGNKAFRSPRILMITKDPMTVEKAALQAAPSNVKLELADLVAKGKIALVDDPTGANTTLTAAAIRSL